jgi:DNA-binding LytR/AlgR family response regulator
MNLDPRKSPTALIAEDEPVLRSQLKEFLAAVWPDLHVVAAVEDGQLALQAIERHQPDVLFLDIEMPGVGGIEIAKRVAGRCHAVFVTAYDQYAVAAFEEEAADYVMKPLSSERLAIACERVKRRLATVPVRLDGLLEFLARRTAQGQSYLRWINASEGSDVRLLTVDEICYFQSDAKYTRAVTLGRDFFIRKSLKELLDELDPSLFWQIHRGTIVNANAIAAVSRDFAGHMFVKLKTRNETLAISQPFAHRFRQM